MGGLVAGAGRLVSEVARLTLPADRSRNRTSCAAR